MSDRLVSRADLVRALARGEATRDALAESLGYQRRVRPADVKRPERGHERLPDPDEAIEVEEDSDVRKTEFVPNRVPFIVPRHYVGGSKDQQNPSEEGMSETETRIEHGDTTRGHQDGERALFPLLCPVAEVIPRLRMLAALERPSAEPDIRRIIADLGRGRVTASLPRLSRHGMGAHLHLIQDLSHRMSPYATDQGVLSLVLRDLLSPASLTISSVRESVSNPEVHWPTHRPLNPTAMLPDSVALVLGDLGALCTGSGRTQMVHRWIRFGKVLASAGVRPVALVPCQLELVPVSLRRTWTVLPWHNARLPATRSNLDDLEDLKRRLLSLVSTSISVESRLLRLVRCSFADLRPYPELEALIWQDSVRVNAGRTAFTFRPAHRQALNAVRLRQRSADRRSAIELTRIEHRSAYVGIRMAEVLNGGSDHFTPEEISAASDWFTRIDRQVLKHAEELDRRIDFFRVVAPHCTASARQLCPALDRNWFLYLKHAPPELPVEAFSCIHQHGSEFQLKTISRNTSEQGPGSHVADLVTADREISISALDGGFDAATDFWSDAPPSWAHAWGIDGYGLWAELVWEADSEVGKSERAVAQRFRWIPSGTFLMGSPESDEEAFGDEKPQREVELTHGFWLAETPCTQVFWRAVVGTTPSRFEGAEHPVERVSWEDCAGLLEKLRERHPDCDARLPTEAQWEYACRAGTTTPRYSESLVSELGWYVESSDGSTHDVAGKEPNGGGLFDMLGNVYEWCRDAWSEDHTGADARDPWGEGTASAYRVVRGGSWNSDARLLRSAYRGRRSPVNRRSDFGFRCEVQGSEPSPVAEQYFQQGGRAERTESRRPSAEQGDSGDQVSGAVPTDARDGTSELPTGGNFFAAIRRIGLSRLNRPAWAVDWGLDQFGVWADLVIMRNEKADAESEDASGFRLLRDSTTGQQVSEERRVAHRFRLIPPGTFLMGSPNDEAERHPREGPQHEVMISTAFWLAETACSQEFWVAVMGENRSRFRVVDHPVEMVSWKECEEFCSRLNQHFLAADVRLPSEAEWEYACRADTTTSFNTGENVTTDQANYDGNFPYSGFEKGKYRHRTLPCRMFDPNAWGLYQVHGNVYEWCADGLREYSEEPQIDPWGSTDTSVGRVVRGGSYFDDGLYLRSAYRVTRSCDVRRNTLGFRCEVQARELQQQVCEGIASVERRRQRAEPGGDRDTASGARATSINLADPENSSIAIPDAPAVRIVSDVEEVTLERVRRPAWATAMGRDRCGLWVEFQVPQHADHNQAFERDASRLPAWNRQHQRMITQRLRWIPPGQFQFGSPADEPGRWDEGELEARTAYMDTGFWLMDTPVTQAFWFAVMGENPSHFQSDRRPVERVSWDDCQQFLTRLPEYAREHNVNLPRMSLPAERSWEHACRAGTTDATYAGPVEYLGDGNAPMLDGIAWYSGNCGIGWELPVEQGSNLSWINDKQYEFEVGGTRAVASKAPNRWGLYDMLGNVFEWCQDVWSKPGDEELREPAEASALRVICGGSWYSNARYLRSAYRGRLLPDYRYYSIGFRCEVQESEQRQEGEG